MSINLIRSGVKMDLKELPLDSRVAIFTGTFDPVHIGHLDVADQVLHYDLEGGSVNWVLFYPHTHSTKKIPAPISVRVDIMMALLSKEQEMGILLVDEEEQKGSNQHESSSWVNLLIN